MYEPMKEEFVEGTSSAQEQIQTSLNLTRDDEREIFVDNLLTNFLGPEKLKEKGALVSKIKYKRHQIEGSLKTVKKDDEKKKGKTSHKHKRIVITSKMKKSLNMYKIDKDEKLDYSKYEKMNETWKAYASSCLLTCLPKSSDTLDKENILNCLKQIDYHGCLITIVRSSSKFQIGLTGIVLQDRRNVFYILCKDNSIKIVPKFGSLFEFELLGCKYTLVGSNMCYRPEMRTTKHAKIKSKKDIR